MKKIAILFLSSFFAIAGISQKQIDDANAEVRSVESFHGIKSSSGITVYLVQGDQESVVVSANDVKHRNKINTVVKNGVLNIYYDNDDWKLWQVGNGRKLRAYVSVKDIDLIDVVSGSDVKIEGTIRTNNIKLDISSGASLKGSIEATNMKVDVSSGAVIILSGSVSDKVSFDGSSGSSFQGFNLVADNCDADVSSGSGIQITVNKELNVDVSSGGYVHYKGSALIRKVQTSSGGSVTKK